jgi:glycerate 2-kinase
MLTSEQFYTHSIRNLPEGSGIARILAAAIQAVEPGAAVRKACQLKEDKLLIGERTFELEKFKRIFLIGIGKAALTMTASAQTILGDRVSSGLIVTKKSSTPYSMNLPVLLTGHPIPDKRSLDAGQQIFALLDGLAESDLVIFLISGGGSALVTFPYPGISLQDMQILTAQLLACGARVDEINTLRRQLDQVKGGGLARRAAPASQISLILSDVVGNPLEAIASGPTVPDPTSRVDALNILKKYQLMDMVPESIKLVLESKTGDYPGDKVRFEKDLTLIIGSNLMAAQAALEQARLEGFNSYLLRNDLQGEAREVAHDLSTHLRWAWQRGDPVPRPACIIAGGETTVSLKGNGRGGRNQELALSAVTDLAGFPDVMLITLATDGEDGVTDAAGAVVTGDSYARAVSLGMHPGDFLVRNDSYPFFQALDDLIKIGSTGTNVNDLTFLLTF